MRNKRIQNQITAGRWTLPAVILICTCCWVASYLLFPNLAPLPKDGGDTYLWQAIRSFLPARWNDYVVSYLVYAVIGYFLIELNNRFAIIRIRASVQTAIYFLFVTACPEIHPLYAGDVASLAFLVSLYFLFGSYQRFQSSGHLFYSFLFIGAGSLVFPQLVYLSIPWLLGAYYLQSLNARSFCGALMGLAFPYWFLLGHAFFYDQMELFRQPFQLMVRFGKPFDFAAFSAWEWATLGYLFAHFAVSAAHCVTAGFEDKIRTRAYLQFLINLTGFLFLAIILQPAYCKELLPLLMISDSVLTGHFFTLTNSKASNVFFIVSLGALILLFGFNIWTLL